MAQKSNDVNKTLEKEQMLKNLKEFKEKISKSSSKNSKAKNIKRKSKTANKPNDKNAKKLSSIDKMALIISKVDKRNKFVFGLRRVIAFSLVSIICICTLFVFKTPIERAINVTNASQSSLLDYDGLMVHFVDVGQADAIVIELPDDKIMLIDAGDRFSNSKGKLLSYLDANIFNDRADDVIDYLVLTHSDSDHSGGIADIFEQYTIGTFYRPKQFANNILNDGLGQRVEMTSSTSPYNVVDTVTYENAIQASIDENCTVIYNEEGLELSGTYLTKQYNFTWYSPVANLYCDTNDYSPIVLLEYNQRSILLTGDAETINETEAASTLTENISIDVFKMGHHGSRTSTTQTLLNRIGMNNITYAVVSCGADNSYGHPHQEAINRLISAGVSQSNIYRTDTNGNIIANITNSGQILVVTDVANLPVYIYSEYLIVLIEIAAFYICFINYKKIVS